MALFVQDSFAGGLDTEFDATKSPKNSYPLLINGRARRNVIQPTNKHVNLSAPDGNYQGLYGAGSFLVLFIAGKAYYADVTVTPIVFTPIASWITMDINVSRLYAEIVPATSSFFNRVGAPSSASLAFNNSIAAFSQALFVFDGSDVNRPQAIFPNGSTSVLPDFPAWTIDNPLYVPFGLLPCFANNKLFLVSPDRKRILQSVSGRASDFMVNITNDGHAGGDADTVSATISFNDITSIRSLSSGQLLASTLYGSWVVDLDYANPIFGEPYLNPIFLFPAGAINELSSISLAAQIKGGGNTLTDPTIGASYADTAFITQSGIHAFNSVAQALKESNNFPLGAPIKGLLLNPATNKTLIQSDTCAVNYDDYGLFALNTIHGYGVLVYDTVHKIWISLDLSFGHVKQFANLKIAGQERLFFITHENKVYEAFANTAEVNSTRVYLGEWCPQSADQMALTHMIDSQFLHVKTSGQVKMTVFADGEKHGEQVLDVSSEGYVEAPPIPIPFINKRKSKGAGWQFDNKALAWNTGVMLEWNFNGELAEMSIDGKIITAENTTLEVPTFGSVEEFAFMGETGGVELNTGAPFNEGFICVGTTIGHVYEYIANGNGRLVSGAIIIHDRGIFTANNSRVAIEGPGFPYWSLRDITNLANVLAGIDGNGIGTVIGGGNHSYHFGTKTDVDAGGYPLAYKAFTPTAGPVDIGAESGKYFYAYYKIPRYFNKPFNFVEFFYYDYNSNNSLQDAWLQKALRDSRVPFKLVVAAVPPYTTEQDGSPGDMSLRKPFITWGAHGVLSGVGRVMERRVVFGLPYFVCGTGGYGLGQFASATSGIDSFRSNTTYGYLHIRADALTCLFTFRDTLNNVLDEYAIYT